MNDLFLKVACPCCLADDRQISPRLQGISDSKIRDSLVLLGDEEQNMQCLYCGFASNKKMKSHINDKPFPQEFKDVCRNINDRWWAPSVFTTDHYMVVPFVKNIKLKWRIFGKDDPETEVVVPYFSDAYKMVEKLEKNIGDQI